MPTQNTHEIFQRELDLFDETFGKKGPTGNCDSIGRDAGCDDCFSSIEYREEIRTFLLASLQRASLVVVEEACGERMTERNMGRLSETTAETEGEVELWNAHREYTLATARTIVGINR